MPRSVRCAGRRLAGWLLASVWIVLPILPVLGLVISRLAGASDF